MLTVLVVSRAFQVLSDSDKKSRYDKFGGDPDSKFAPSAGPSGSSSPFSGFSSRPAGGPMFEEEISPEELFNRFFGGGVGGMGGMGGMGGGFSPFGMTLKVPSYVQALTDVGGPQFVFNMGGGPGFRVHQFGGGAPRRRPREASQSEPPPTGWGLVQQLLPLILFFIVLLISTLLSGSPTPPGPSYRFDAPVTPHTMHRMTPKLNVNYYVNPTDVETYDKRRFRQLDQRVEVDFVTKLRYECEGEVQTRDRMVQDAQGWFFPDVEKMKAARAMEMKSCRRLDTLKGRY